MLTRRGWSLFGASVGLYAGGRVLGLVPLSVLAAAAGLLLVGAAWWTRTRHLDLRATRRVSERLQVGGEGRVDLAVTAAGARSLPTLALVDDFDSGRRHARFLLPPLASGETGRAAYRIPTERRGRFELGPLRASVGDPFGLARIGRPVLGLDDAIVYPRVNDVLPPPEIGGDDIERDAPLLAGRPDTGGEFLALRAYAPGDDMRRVHWRSTARRGELMVRQDESRKRAPVLVVLDVRPGAHDRASFETAVEATASIVSAIERVERPWQLSTSSGARLGTPGRRHLASVLDELAVIEPDGPDRMTVALSRRRVSALIAVTGRLRDDDTAALGMLVRGGGLLSVVCCRELRAPRLPVGRRIAPLVVGVSADRPFPLAWNEAVLLWQRRDRRLQPVSLSRH